MSNGEARQIHSSRPLSERIEDEASTEVLTTDFQEWLANPKKFDMPHVDEKAPVTFEYDDFYDPKIGSHDGKITAIDDKERLVGWLSYTRDKHGMHLDLLRVLPKFKGKGYSVFLLREFINVQDEHCMPATLEPSPFAGELWPGETADQRKGAWQKQLETLIKLYSSFGFERGVASLEECMKFEKCEMTRQPVCEGGKKHEQW